MTIWLKLLIKKLMNILQIIKILLYLLSILSVSACGFIENKPMNDGIVISEQVFLDTTSKKIAVFTDNIISNLNANIKSEIEKSGNTIVNDTNHANVLLKVKTRFNGKASYSQMQEMIRDNIGYDNIEKLPEKDKSTPKVYDKTSIDYLIEDPSGMIIGFAIGSALSNPIIMAPIGIISGTIINQLAKNYQKNNKNFTILDIEIHEKAQKPIWYTDKRIHKKDEYSIRKYDYSESTNWKIYRTTVIITGIQQTEEVAKMLSSILI